MANMHGYSGISDQGRRESYDRNGRVLRDLFCRSGTLLSELAISLPMEKADRGSVCSWHEKWT